MTPAAASPLVASEGRAAAEQEQIPEQQAKGGRVGRVRFADAKTFKAAMLGLKKERGAREGGKSWVARTNESFLYVTGQG